MRCRGMAIQDAVAGVLAVSTAQAVGLARA